LIAEIDQMTPVLKSLGDLNNDGSVSIIDLVLLHRKVAGID
jgi:hypothetical protein